MQLCAAFGLPGDEAMLIQRLAASLACLAGKGNLSYAERQRQRQVLRELKYYEDRHKLRIDARKPLAGITIARDSQKIELYTC
jgi:hypothetical protein